MLQALRIFVLCTVVVAAAWPAPASASPVQQDNLVPLVYGQTVDGTIDDNQPSVFYIFDASAGDVITVAMVVTGGDLDPFLVLNNSDRVPLTTDDNSGGGVNARLTFVIPAAGQYIIQAAHSGGIPPAGGGAFSLNLTTAVESATPPAEPTQEVSPAPTETPAADSPAAQGDSTRLAKLERGSTVRDTLDRQVALRFYWFEAEGGDQVAITPEQLADFQPLIALYDANFVELQRATPGAGIRTNLENSGIYFLGVSLPDVGNAGGGYGFVFEQSVNPAESENFVDIAYGQSQRGNIDSNISAVTYRFNGAAGDSVTITMSRAGGDLNSYLYLLDGQGELLFEDNDSGGDNSDARITYTLPADGVYLIVATRLGQAQGTTSGSYLLELASDGDVPPPVVEEEAEPVLPADYEPFPLMAYGETVEGELSGSRFMDLYVFLGQRDDTITVEMNSQNGDETNGLDPLLILLDDGRIPLAEHDDIVDGVERDARLEFTLPRTAYYAVVATRFDQDAGVSAGPYSLTLSGPGGEVVEETEQAAPTQETLLDRLVPATLEVGTTSQGIFDAGAVLYTFEAESGSLADLSATTDAGLDSALILADENLNEILSSSGGAITGVPIPKSGRYLVILAPRFGPAEPSGGGYTLALAQTEAGDSETAVADGVQAIAYGDTLNGVIDEEQASHLYTFEGSAGDQVRITMEATPGSTLDCYLELQGPDGAIVEANDDIDPGVVRDSLIAVELPADGTFTVVASRYVGPDADPTAGTYRLSLEHVDENAAVSQTSSQTIPLVYGQTEVAEINDEQYLVFFVFDGRAGDMVTVELDNLTGNLDSVLHLYQSAGTGWTEIASNDDSPTGGTYEALLKSIILPQTGKYLIAVNRYGLDRESSFGTFSITLTLESQ